MSFNKQKSSLALGSGAGTVVLDLTNNTSFQVTLSGTVTFDLSAVTPGSDYKIILYLLQDATGNRTVTWPGNVKWAAGTPTVLSTAAGALDLVALQTFDSGANWYGMPLGSNFS